MTLAALARPFRGLPPGRVLGPFPLKAWVGITLLLLMGLGILLGVLLWTPGRTPAPGPVPAAGPVAAQSLARTGRGPGDADVTAILATSDYLRRAGMSELASRYDPQRLVLFLVQEDLHEALPPAWTPMLLAGDEAVTPTEGRVLIEASHHRLSLAAYPRFDASGRDRLAAPLELTLPPVRADVAPDVLRWPAPPARQAAGAAPLSSDTAIPPAAILGLFAGFLVSMWPCLFQLTAYFIPSLAGLSMAQAEQAQTRHEARLSVLRTAVFFVLGIVIVYTLGGLLAGLGAQTLRGSELFEAWRRPLMVVAAVVVLAMALRVAIRARAPLVCKMPLGRFGHGGADSPWSTMLLGLAFATGCMTCFGAALALGLATYIFTTGSALTGALIMFLFALGISVPLVVAALAMARVMPFLFRLERWAPRLAWASSAVMAGFALLLLTDSYHVVTDWLYRLPVTRGLSAAVVRADTLAPGLPATVTPTTGAGAISGGSARLQLVEGSASRPLANGATVPIAPGLAAEVFLAPYPPRLTSDVDVYLYRPDAGEPVTTARLSYIIQMVQMDHGSDRGEATTRRDGHYLLPLELPMYGDYLLTIRIDLPEGVQALQLYLLVLP